MKNKIIGSLILLFSASILLTGCGASTNSLTVKKLEKTQKAPYEALKHAKKFALIDTTSDNYQDWKNSILSNGRTIKFDRYNKCVDVFIGKYHTAYVKDRRLQEFKQCSSASRDTKSSVIVTIEDNNIWGSTLAAYQNVWYFSNMTYTNFTISNFAVIENDNGTAEIVIYKKSKQNKTRVRKNISLTLITELEKYKVKILKYYNKY